MLTPIQKKILEATRLLVEVRLLAAEQDKLFTEAGDRPSGRYYEELALELKDNMGSSSLESRLRHVENTPPYKEIPEITPEQVTAAMENMLRYIRARGKDIGF